MLCIGGPRHGQDVKWSGSFFKAPVLPPRRAEYWNPSRIPTEPVIIPLVTYYRQEIVTSRGQRIGVWVVE